MREIKVKNFRKFCGTRGSGKKFWEMVLKDVCNKEDRVILDFEGVVSATPSFLDEAIIKPIIDKELDPRKIKMINFNFSLEEKLKRAASFRGAGNLEIKEGVFSVSQDRSR